MDSALSFVAGLPATTAISGILAVGATSIDALGEYNISPQNDTAIFNHLMREVKECRSSVNALCKMLTVLMNAQLPFPNRASWIHLDVLVATLTDTVFAFSRLYSLCCDVDEELVRSSPSVACKKLEKRCRALSARLRWHNLSIAMMMTIINCPSEQDARNSRQELARRVARLLTFNVSLAARLRHTSDNSSRPVSASNAAKTDASDAQATDIIHADVGPTPTTLIRQASFQSCTLTDKKTLSHLILPVALSELRDDCGFYISQSTRLVEACCYSN